MNTSVSLALGLLFFLMILRPPRSTRTDTLFPYTTLFRSFSAAGMGYSPGRTAGKWWDVLSQTGCCWPPRERTALLSARKQARIAITLATIARGIARRPSAGP